MVPQADFLSTGQSAYTSRVRLGIKSLFENLRFGRRPALDIVRKQRYCERAQA
jgi:hypothetical protein